MGIFHCYVSLPEGTAQRKIKKLGKFHPRYALVPVASHELFGAEGTQVQLVASNCNVGGPSQTNRQQPGRQCPENRHAFPPKKAKEKLSPQSSTHFFFWERSEAMFVFGLLYFVVYLLGQHFGEKSLFKKIMPATFGLISSVKWQMNVSQCTKGPKFCH